jgi:hypothetical protein
MEATGNDAHQNVLATWTQVITLQNQQNNHIQNNTQTSLDPWNTTEGYGFHFKQKYLECFQPNVLSMIVDAPWYMPNTVIRRDLQTPSVKKKSVTTDLSTVRATT